MIPITMTALPKAAVEPVVVLIVGSKHSCFLQTKLLSSKLYAANQRILGVRLERGAELVALPKVGIEPT